jgi:acetylornithine deacetylase/succinyl-diaminopimelate desuccinylase-like protein
VDDLALSGYVESSKQRILGTLVDWLRTPSISADPARAADVVASAEFCAGLMRQAGLHNVEVLPVVSADGRPQGHGGGGPAVYGEWLEAGDEAPTVLVYGHHDVQPVDPLDEWLSPPFEPTVSEGLVLARGSSDDKGQVLMQIEAARGLLAEQGRLPVNLKLLIEGEEEVGSPHLEEFLVKQKQRLAADVIVISDTTMVAPDVPSTTVSMRGLTTFDVTLRTARSDLHSGIWGGTVPNAAVVAARVVTALHDALGRVTIPGFYDQVAELSDEESQSLAAVPYDEADFCRQAGVNFLEGERGRSAYERTGTRPTAEVVGLHAGYGGPGMKTIVPATANFKVALRLVPHQEPEEIAAAFQRWLAEQVPTGVEVSATSWGSVSPLLTPVDHPAVITLSRAVEKVWGKAPLFTRSGGSGPEEALGRVLEAPLIFLGVALPDDNFHAPNERLVLSQFWRGIVAAGELLIGLGQGVGPQ